MQRRRVMATEMLNYKITKINITAQKYPSMKGKNHKENIKRKVNKLLALIMSGTYLFMYVCVCMCIAVSS